MILINLFILLLLAFVAIYAIYWLMIAFASRNRRKFIRKGRYPISNYYNNIVIIIYAHNDVKTVAPLLEALNKQNYPVENYKTYIILDNCTDNSSNVLEMIGGANFFRVGESYTVGKDESITQLLERLLTLKNINAYAFLGANRSVDENFLNAINIGLYTHDVLVASTVLNGKPITLKDKIVGAYNKFENNIINTSRSMLGLTSLINSDSCVIKQNVIEKVQCIDFKNINTEFKYSLMLSKLNYKVSYDPNIITYINYKDYKVRKASFSYRLTLLKNSIPMFLSSSFKFFEFCMSATQPSMFTLLFLLVFLGWVFSTFNFAGVFASIFTGKILYILVFMFILSSLLSIMNAKLSFKELGYLLLYPFYSFLMLLRSIPIIKQICNFIDKCNNPEQNEKFSVPVVVSAGNKKMDCKIELIKIDGMIKGIFSFKNKKQATDLQLRVYDAIKSISDMLAEYECEIVDPNTKEVVEKCSFDLEICQNCKYFTTKQDGTINVIKGSCSLGTKETGVDDVVMLWQSCPNYVSGREKIVDLNQYRKDN